MKTIEQVLARREEQGCFDSRDITRLSQFMTVEQIESAGMKFASDEARATHVPLPYTRENILKQLEQDVAFGFEKALNRRGISSGLMFEVVMMWNWLLEEGLEEYDPDTGYAMYGLPLFKATAVKYGFDNPIGDDLGSEYKYDEEDD